MDMPDASQGKLTFDKRDFVIGMQIQAYQEVNLGLGHLFSTPPLTFYAHSAAVCTRQHNIFRFSQVLDFDIWEQEGIVAKRIYQET